MEFNQKQEKSTKIYKILKGKIMEEPQPICININICIWGSLLSQVAPLKECVVNMWGKKDTFYFLFFPSVTFFKHLFRHSCTLEVSTHHLGFQTYGIFTTLLMQDSDGYKKIYQPSVRTDLDGPRHIRFMHCRQQQNAYQQSHVAALLIHPSVLHKYC